MCKQNAKKWDLSHALIKIQKLEDIHGTKKKLKKTNTLWYLFYAAKNEFWLMFSWIKQKKELKKTKTFFSIVKIVNVIIGHFNQIYTLAGWPLKIHRV